MSIVELRSDLSNYRAVAAKKADVLKQPSASNLAKKLPESSDLDPENVTKYTPSNSYVTSDVVKSEVVDQKSTLGPIEPSKTEGNIEVPDLKIIKPDLTSKLLSEIDVETSKTEGNIEVPDIKIKQSNFDIVSNLDSTLEDGITRTVVNSLNPESSTLTIIKPDRRVSVNRDVDSGLDTEPVRYKGSKSNSALTNQNTSLDPESVEFTSGVNIASSFLNSSNNITTPRVIQSSGVDIPRGGTLAGQRAVEDLKRWTDWLDTQKGQDWISQQRRLSLMNPNVETRLAFRDSSLLQGSGVGNFLNSLDNFSRSTGLALRPNTAPNKIFNKQGVLLSVRHGFQGMHAASKGFESDPTRTTYEAVIRENNESGNNRLVRMYREAIQPGIEKLEAGQEIPASQNLITNTIGNVITDVSNLSNLIGLGTTGFGRAINTLAGFSRLFINEGNLGPFMSVSQLFGPDSYGGVGATYISRFYDSMIAAHNRALEYGFSTDLSSYSKNLESRAYGAGTAYVDGVNVGIVDSDQEKSKYKVIGASNFTVGKKRVRVGGVNGPNVRETEYGLKEGDVVSNSIYKAQNMSELVGSKSTGNKDFVKFFFMSVNGHPNAGNLDSGDPNDRAFAAVFRATFDPPTDFFQPSYNTYQPIGRADPVYTFRSFERTYDLSFKVFAHSKSELRAQWQKLNFLATMTTPEYREEKMVPPIMRITVGDYFRETPAILRSLVFGGMGGDSGWEINIEEDPDNKQMPFSVNVSCNFTILHDSRPQLHGKLVGAKRGVEGDYGWLEGNSIDNNFSGSYNPSSFNSVAAAQERIRANRSTIDPVVVQASTDNLLDNGTLG